MTEVKFCGLTRAVDAQVGGALGAAYLGVIFAGGPRHVEPASARLLFEGAGDATARRVGVFGTQTAQAIAETAAAVALDVVQLHGPSDAALVELIRQNFGGEIWRVVRIPGVVDAATLTGAADGVDGVVVDTLVAGALGGSGVVVDWESLADALDRAGRPPRLVLAGGLRPENVARAVGLVAPDVVDVSSGIELSTGIKDHERMRAFAEAAARGGR